MGIRIKILPERHEIVLDIDRIQVKELIKKLGFSLEEVVVVKRGSIVLEEEYVEANEDIEVYRAVSGG